MIVPITAICDGGDQCGARSHPHYFGAAGAGVHRDDGPGGESLRRDRVARGKHDIGPRNVGSPLALKLLLFCGERRQSGQEAIIQEFTILYIRLPGQGICWNRQ